MSNTITIESIIRRTGGTRGVTMGNKTYNFLPNAEGAHVCDVSDGEHAQRFLGIPEGYRIYSPAKGVSVEGGVGATRAAEKAEPPAAAVEPQKAQSGKQEEPSTATTTDETANAATTEPKTSEKPAEEAVALDGLDTDKLRAIFEEEVGRKPHPNAKDETLIAQIEAVREDKAGQ